ncbi:MAG: hypothetical protein QOC60_450 [Frankiaceae bacterium]|nr:hypothetical protein [Frankiaceae bacterium]
MGDPSASDDRVPLVGFVLAQTSGGIGRHVRDLAGRLTELGQPPYVVAPRDVIDRFSLDAVAAATAVDVADARSFGAARRAIRRVSAASDVVHAHGLRAGAMAARSRVAGGAPVVQTWHNLPPTDGVAGRIGTQLARLSARGTDITLAVSDDLVALALASGARDARWTPVAAPAIGTPTRSVAAVRADLGAANRPLVVAVGRLARQKGFDVLGEAGDILAEETNPPVIAVAGEGPERATLSGTTLVLLGARDDIASLLAAADVVVMPSRWEGWPLVAQEALRAGKALIASRVGGLPRLAGDAVEWVPADDPGALAVALRRLLADDVRRGALEAAARRRALELPDEAATMAALLAVYREVRR